MGVPELETLPPPDGVPHVRSIDVRQVSSLILTGQRHQFDAAPLLRHRRLGLGEEDRRANDDAIAQGARILSAYHLDTGVKIWIITGADRSSTCILLPEEY